MQEEFIYDGGSYRASFACRFTGKERDSESGLDYFGARYMASTMGRFMSPDSVGGSPENPQSWNLYSYVQNNPLTNTDPDGHDCIDTSHYEIEGTVTVTTGTSCASDPANYGTYVDGTVDTKSLTTDGKGSFGYSYSNYANGSGSAGGGVISPSVPYGSLEGPANLAGLQTLGAADKLVTNATIGVAGVYGGLAVAAVGPEAAAAVGRWGLQRLAMGASSPALSNLINRLYQAQDELPGGTVGALRNEVGTGEYIKYLGGHAEKAANTIRALEKLIKSGELSRDDQMIASHIISDLKNALGK